MSMVAFHCLFPEIFAREVRTAMAFKTYGLPDGVPFLFQEAYCVDPHCECRRVLIQVMNVSNRQQAATISHAFDPENDSHGMGQTFLDRLNRQTQHSPGLLELFRHNLGSGDYAARLERHYHLVKEAVKDPTHPMHKLLNPIFGSTWPLRREAPRVSRNALCPCQSGRKYKKCCEGKEGRPEQIGDEGR